MRYQRVILTIDPSEPALDDILIRLAAEKIGEAEAIEVELTYRGYESAPDILRIDREGQIIAAVEDA